MSYHYNQRKESLENELKLLETYSQVNLFLKENDWLFVTPTFFQGFELGIIHKLSMNGDSNKEEITKVIFRKFYNLEHTASFIEGYCKRCNHIKPFLESIENSLILIFQRDYEGGIKTLIPIIEGILRKYLVTEKELDNSHIPYKKLRLAFDNLKDELIDNCENELRNWTDQNKIKVNLSEDQIKELMRLEKEYYDIWFSFIKEFIDNSFYLNTKNIELTNELNRHSILHEFGMKFNYNLENYIKVYFVLHFLTWIFLRKERKSILNNIGGFRLFEKMDAYYNIIKKTSKFSYDKHLLLKEYQDYNSERFLEKFVVKEMDLPYRIKLKYKILKGFNRFLWYKGLK